MLPLALFLTILLSTQTTFAVIPSPNQIRYIISLTELFEKVQGVGFLGVIYPNYQWEGNRFPLPEDYLLPLVILWNPALSFPSVFSDQSMCCPDCQLPSKVRYWNDGSTTSRQPRAIHSTDDTVLLVSTTFVCSNNHHILAHDERVLKLIPAWCAIPFSLLYKSGVSETFLDTCNAMCSHGMNMYKIESIIADMRWRFHSKREEKYWLAVKEYASKEKQTNNACIQKFPSFEETGMKKLPSNDLISKCFLKQFLKYEPFFIKSMQSLNCKKYLSLDHTFKVATNVGYVQDDGKWVSMYESVLFVFNEDGNILTWQFTRSTAFDEVAEVLRSLHQRISCLGGALDTIIIDNCCQWRNKLQCVFGQEVDVKLDLFHAVQRVTRKLPKRHPYYHACSQDFRLVLRDTGDHGPLRQQTTPSPEMINRNLDHFVEKWKDIDKDGWKILPSQALAEVLKLKVHVRKGCLSGIRTGCGTNRNEAFHKHLNSILSKNRLGVLLAYALVFTAVYSHNSNLKCKGKRIIRPISAAVASGTSGLSDDSQIVHEQIGIPRALLNGSHESTSMHMSMSTSQDEPNESDEVLHTDVCVSILECASNVYTLTRSLWKHMGRSANRKWLYLPYVQKVEDISFSSGQRGTWQNHEYNIEQILSDWMFKRIKVDSSNGVGDCFFQSIVMNIMERSEIAELVQIQGDNMSEMVKDLRSKLVKEWLGENREYYMQFLVFPEQVEQCKEQMYEAMAVKFLQMGFYSSDIGDIMPLGLSNAVGLPIVIFNSNSENPLLHIIPRVIKDSTPLFLTYNGFGDGHYDYASYCGDPPEEWSTKRARGCSCGVNYKVYTQSCANNKAYQSRCKCLKAKKGCTSACRCKNCGNPNGQRAIPTKTRQRHAYDWQKKLPTQESFVVDKGGSLKQSEWSQFENAVFILLLQQMKDCIDEQPPKSILTTFNRIVELSRTPQCKVSLPQDAVLHEKRLNQITGKLKHYRAECELFKKLSKV